MGHRITVVESMANRAAEWKPVRRPPNYYIAMYVAQDTFLRLSTREQVKEFE